MRPVRFHPRIETDLDDATAYYDARQRGLGDRFLSEFRATVGIVSEIGHIFRQVHGPYGHLKFTTFPYFVYFRPDGEGFLVMLVINAAREPVLIQNLLDNRR